MVQIAAVSKDVFLFIRVPPPPGRPVEGPDCHVRKEIYRCWPVSARIRGVINFQFSC